MQITIGLLSLISLIGAVIWQADALYTQAIILGCTHCVVGEIRKLSPTHNGGESDG